LKEFPYLDPSTLKNAVIVCHRNADPDAYLSAYALSSLVRKVSPDCVVEVATPGGVTTLTSKLAPRFPVKPAQEMGKEYDLYVAVDVGDVDLLEDWKERMKVSKGKKVLVDHHPSRKVDLYDETVVDEEATSAAEVVFTLFEESGTEVSKDVAQALLMAMLFDSSHLAIAGENGLRTAVKLIDAGADLVAAKRDLRSDPDFGEVMAKLKGAQRLKAYRLGPWVVAASQVGSFQAHVARSLVYLGADVGVVGGESEGETRVSLRSNQRFAEKTKVHLGTDLAEKLAGETWGHGGGHSTAASFTTTMDEDEAVDKVLDRLGELVREERKEL
jgi:nanoRNase/pAp phosphatase (c-di-AMP/oligoRNAs hydrolase)